VKHGGGLTSCAFAGSRLVASMVLIALVQGHELSLSMVLAAFRLTSQLNFEPQVLFEIELPCGHP
jgi:hypothetical protein